MVRPALTVDGVALWFVDLDDLNHPDATVWLSQSEWSRAARFVFERDARRYRAAHSHLRYLLWQQCRWPAAAEFSIGAFGKPGLGTDASAGFNLSDSGPLGMIGIGEGEGIGVDIEQLRPLDDVWLLASQHFTSDEVHALRALPGQEVQAGFMTLWTRKEACLKAIGTGLSVAPSTFAVGLRETVGRVVVHTGSGGSELRLHGVERGPSVRAAVARVVGGWAT